MTQTIHHLPRLGMADAMRLFGLTARALRFYEEKGLVEARRDRLNARFYDPAARGRLDWIARLRRAGVPLPAVREVLDAHEEGRAPEVARRILERRRAELTAELTQVEQVLGDLAAPPVTPARRLVR
jgi:DNA-binding transcriptional MerR regulator